MTHHLRGEQASRRVWLDGCELLPAKSQRVFNHSPDGFYWGYAGSGPAQLALAVYLELAGSERVALRRYQQFKLEVISRLEGDFDTEFDFGDHYQEITIESERQQEETKAD